jgi:large subunit ribosomal protein L13
MKTVKQSTQSIKESEIQREWHIFDMSTKPLGRIIPEIARFLQGKHKKNYVSYLDMGDNVVVINASRILISGNKAKTKEYTYFSGYPGGLRRVTFQTLKETKPVEIVRHAVAGMLPKNKHRDRRLARLFVFKDEKHPYSDKFKIPSFAKATEGKQKSKVKTK